MQFSLAAYFLVFAALLICAPVTRGGRAGNVAVRLLSRQASPHKERSRIRNSSWTGRGTRWSSTQTTTCRSSDAVRWVGSACRPRHLLSVVVAKSRVAWCKCACKAVSWRKSC